MFQFDQCNLVQYSVEKAIVEGILTEHQVEQKSAQVDYYLVREIVSFGYRNLPQFDIEIVIKPLFVGHQILAKGEGWTSKVVPARLCKCI